MPTARSQASFPAPPKRGSRFMILSLVVMIAALTFLGFRMYTRTAQRTPATPASTPAPGGAGGESPPAATPNLDRNG